MPSTTNTNDKISAIHHYVPQSYLKRFSCDRKKSQIYAYELNKDPYRTNVKNVAAEKGFYNYTDEKGNKTSELEDSLAEIDTQGADLFEMLDTLGTGYIHLDDGDKQNLLTYISLLHARNARDRRENAEFLGEASLFQFQILASDREAYHKNARKALANNGHEYNEVEIEKSRLELLDGGFKVNYNPKDQYFLGQSLAKSQVLYKVLYQQKRIVICETTSSRRIVTSDNPVTYYGPPEHPNIMPLGYIHAVFQLPLSPTKMLFLVNDDMALGDFKLSREHVDYHNFYTYMFAERWIFSDITSKTIKEMFAKNNSKEPSLQIGSPFKKR